MNEINHRAKNLLTVVQAMAQQTGRRYEGDDFFRVFSKRIASMASNQDLLIKSHENNVDLETLARAQFAHLIDPDDPQVKIGGPLIQLNAAASQAVGMAIFELVTNAAKYGSLSQATGVVELSWVFTDEAQQNIEISWVESGGPEVVAPTREGFGFQVTGPILESITSGSVIRDYTAEGYRWSLNAPLDQLTQQPNLADAIDNSAC